MITRIGVVAGEIWNYLDEHDRSGSLEEMIRQLGHEKELILMSIGWLAREGHVVLEGEAPAYVVRLSDGKKTG